MMIAFHDLYQRLAAARIASSRPHDLAIWGTQLKGLLELCQQKSIERGYVVTKSLGDFGEMTDLPNHPDTQSNPIARIMRIPAPLLCYWMGESEQVAAA